MTNILKTIVFIWGSLLITSLAFTYWVYFGDSLIVPCFLVVCFVCLFEFISCQIDKLDD